MLGIFRPKREEVTGCWRKLGYNVELHNLYCFSVTVKVKVK
jgi:hypothetical protein